jgi:hypothetical protein
MAIAKLVGRDFLFLANKNPQKFKDFERSNDYQTKGAVGQENFLAATLCITWICSYCKATFRKSNIRMGLET